jgi:hypothetical protein
MPINYIEKGPWLHEEIGRQGYILAQTDGIWISNDDVAVQLIIDSFDPLPAAKKEKRQEGKAQALVLANAVYDGAANEDVVFADAAHLRLVIDIDASYRPVAGGIRPRLAQIIAIWDAFKLIKTEINQLTDLASIQAYDVVNNLNWP